MITVTAILMLCAMGIAFYIRFLAALCKECKPQFAFCWVRLRLGPLPQAAELRNERKAGVTRAA